jgi:glycosyltransferase involved in cell wall biosynthesis
MRGIETILSQSMEDFELILVDDGSDKNTHRILEEYAQKDNRIRLIVNEKKLHLASSLNKAIKLARTEYIARADVNISYHPDRLKIQLEFMGKKTDVDILGSNFYWGTDGSNEVREITLPETHDKIIRQLSVNCCICHPSVVYNRNVVIPYGPYTDGFSWAQDYHLWMRVRNKLKFYNLQAPLLTKWHRPKPWKELSKIECFKGNVKSRLAGFFTSPNILLDIVNFPRVFLVFIIGKL